jgi:hypothetical protein
MICNLLTLQLALDSPPKLGKARRSLGEVVNNVKTF